LKRSPVRAPITIGMASSNCDILHIDGSDLHFDVPALARLRPSEQATRDIFDRRVVLRLPVPVPQLAVHVGSARVARYVIDPVAAHPDLAGKFLHASIRLLDNYALMIDGFISPDDQDPRSDATDAEGIRFQPIFIGAALDRNALTVGKGLFERGLHFAGTVTRGNVRACCLCDRCGGSFSLEHFHVGRTWLQYFYCERGIHTITAYLGAPETSLPPCSVCATRFRVLNPLRCRHCTAPYIDFERFPDMRPSEHYGCFVVGEARPAS
jgi:hypothetical protein